MGLFSQQLLTEAHNNVVCRKGTWGGLKSACCPIQNHTALVLIQWTYTCVCLNCTETVAETVAVLTLRVAASSLLLANQVCVLPERSTLLFLLEHVLVILVVCIQQLVPPHEGGGIVPDEVHVMEVVETGTGVERDEVEGVQRDVITADRKQEKKR